MPDPGDTVDEGRSAREGIEEEVEIVLKVPPQQQDSGSEGMYEPQLEDRVGVVGESAGRRQMQPLQQPHSRWQQSEDCCT